MRCNRRSKQGCARFSLLAVPVQYGTLLLLLELVLVETGRLRVKYSTGTVGWDEKREEHSLHQLHLLQLAL